MSAVAIVQKQLSMDLHKLDLEILPMVLIERLTFLTLQHTLLERIKQGESIDPYLIDLREKIEAGKKVDFM